MKNDGTSVHGRPVVSPGSDWLGLVIDLTNTSRYYSPSEWLKQGIKHFKIACKGRDAVPDNESALQIFANARPPGIYKHEYIDALYKFYHEKRPETVTCPSTPEWKRSCDLDLNGNAEDDEDKDGLVAGTSPVSLRRICIIVHLEAVF
ncbi:hypothetical protein ACLOJK_037814 [Asimina triloba]